PQRPYPHPCPASRPSAPSDGPGPHGEPTVIDLINDGTIDMVINTPGSKGARADGYDIRTAATATGRAIMTTMQEFTAAVQAIEAIRRGPFSVRSLQDHDSARAERVAARA